MSNRHKSLAAMIIPSLREIFAERRPCDKPGMTFSFGERGWALTPTESASFHEIGRMLVTAFPKVHLNTCLKELQRFCCENIPACQSPFEAAIPSFLDRLEYLSKIDNIIYVEVSGIRLELPEVDIGPVRFITSTHPEVDRNRLSIMDINGNPPAPVDSGITLARIQVAGELEFAKDIAIEQVQVVLDGLQFLSIRDNHAAFNGSFGFMLTCSQPIPLVSCRQWTYSHQQENWTSSVNCGAIISNENPDLNLPLSEKYLAKLNTYGLCYFHDLVSTPTPSSFDEGLLAAIRWIASGINDGSLTRKYLAFYIALEALFARDSSVKKKTDAYISPSIPVYDGVAFLLGKTVESRIEIAERLRDLAKTRNMIVHRGYTSVERNDLLTLAHYSWNCCAQALKMRQQFHEDNSFSHWCLRKKYETVPE